MFSIYMVGTFLALALGQLLIARAIIGSAAPFNWIVALQAGPLAQDPHDGSETIATQQSELR